MNTNANWMRPCLGLGTGFHRWVLAREKYRLNPDFSYYEFESIAYVAATRLLIAVASPVFREAAS